MHFSCVRWNKIIVSGSDCIRPLLFWVLFLPLSTKVLGEIFISAEIFYDKRPTMALSAPSLRCVWLHECKRCGTRLWACCHFEHLDQSPNQFISNKVGRFHYWTIRSFYLNLKVYQSVTGFGTGLGNLTLYTFLSVACKFADSTRPFGR